MSATPPLCDFGWTAPHFELPGVDGKSHALAAEKGERATLVMFICNHCPYVKSVVDRIARDVRELEEHGVASFAICSNDSIAYPDDSFEKMKKFAGSHNFTFPYLHDADQSVARAYGAVCTPDFFGFDADLGLQYRGRLDASRKEAGPTDLRRDLFLAMKQIAETGQGPKVQSATMGCSIKWRAASP